MTDESGSRPTRNPATGLAAIAGWFCWWIGVGCGVLLVRLRRRRWIGSVAHFTVLISFAAPPRWRCPRTGLHLGGAPPPRSVMVIPFSVAMVMKCWAWWHLFAMRVAIVTVSLEDGFPGMEEIAEACTSHDTDQSPRDLPIPVAADC